jgi:hypothetical protein
LWDLYPKSGKPFLFVNTQLSLVELDLLLMVEVQDQTHILPIHCQGPIITIRKRASEMPFSRWILPPFHSVDGDNWKLLWYCGLLVSRCQAFFNALFWRRNARKGDWEFVNYRGGAIAYGHPLASSGPRLVAFLAGLFKENPDARYGLTTMCVGRGQGYSAIWENIPQA